MQKPSVLVKIGDASKLLGVSIDTLRRWEKSGKIKTVRTPGGTRLYPLDELKKFNPGSVEIYQTNSLSTEELLKKVSEDKNPVSSIPTPLQTEFSPATEEVYKESKQLILTPLKKTIITKVLIGSAFFSLITLIITYWITASYLLSPKETQLFFQNKIASTVLAPFHKLAAGLRLIPPENPPPNPVAFNTTFSPNVLAAQASFPFLEINADTQINGSLFIKDSINGLSMEATPSASTLALTSGNTTLTVTDSALLDQDVSTTSSPSFNSLDLANTLTLGGANSTFHSGTGVPASTLGINGDYYFRTDGTGSSTSLYFKANGAWGATGGGVTSLTAGTDISLSGSTGTITISDNSTLSSVTGRGATTDTALTLNGAITAGSTLKVSGATILSSTLAVTGTTTLTSASVSIGGVSYTFPSSQGSASTVFLNDGSGGLTWSPLATASGWTVSGNNTYLTNTSGNVGIGTSAPGSKLSVAGNLGVGVSFVNAVIPSNGLAVSGNVGIGTTTADYNLSVIGTANFTGNVGIGSSLTTTGLTFASGGLRVNGFSDLTGNVGIGSSLTVTSASVLDSLSVTKSISGVTLGISGASNLSGNVGIGSSLTVTSLIKADSGLTVAAHTQLNGSFVLGDNGDLGSINTSNWDISATGDLSGIGTIAADGVLTLSANNAALSFTGTTPSLTSGSEVFGIFSGGNVGIGTTGNVYGGLTIRGAGTSTGITLQTYGSNLTQGLTVLDNGNAGIGTTSPQQKLTVSGGAIELDNNQAIKWIRSIDASEMDILKLSGWTTQLLGGGGTPTLTINNSDGNTLMTFLEDGNVGIGTSNPDYNFKTQGTGYFSGFVGIGSSLNVSGNVGIGGSLTVSSPAYLNSNALIGYSSTIIGPSSGLAVSGNVGIGITTANSNLSIAGNAHIGSLYQGISAPANGLFVDGNIGIGATTSSNKLDVWGNSRITGTLSVDGATTLAGLTLNLGSDSTGDIFYRNSGGTISRLGIGSAGQSLIVSSGLPSWGTGSQWTTSGNNIYFIGASGAGNVGIGNTYANYSKLQLTGSGTGTGITFQTLDSSGTQRFAVLDNGNVGIGTTAPSQPFQVNTSNTPSFVVNSSGNVGIGISTPSNKLTVFGGNVGIGTTGSVTGALSVMGGNTGIGTLSPTSQLHVSMSDNSSSSITNILTLAHILGAPSSFTTDTGGTLTTNLVSYWKVDEASGTNMADSVGTNNGSATGTSIVAGKLGNTRQYDAANSDKVSITSASNLEAGTDFSVSLWFTNTDADTSEDYIAAKYNSGDNGWLLGKSISTTGDFGFQVRTAAGVSATAKINSQQYNDGGWHHAIGIKSGTNVYLYVDGTQVGTGSNGSLTTTSGSANVIIGSHNGSSSYWTGKIDEITVWNKVLSSTEIADLYNSGNANTYTAGSGTAASGIGSSILLQTADSAGNLENIGQIAGILTTATNESEASALTFSTRTGGGSLTERLRIDGQGNLGIGASVPQAKLVIQGNVGIGYTGANQIIPSNGLAVSGNVGIGITTANSNLSIAGNAHIGSLYQGISAPANGLFVDGNIGIGATTSSNKLDVWGNQRITGTLSVDSTSSFGGNLTLSSGQFLAPNGSASLPSYSFTNSTSTGLYSPSANALALNTNGASTPILTITAGGNVGIGITSPRARLEIKTDPGTVLDSIIINKPGDADRGYLTFWQGNGASGTWRLGQQVYSDRLALLVGATDPATPGTEVMTWQIGGNVGIGFTSPAYKLDVAGSLRVTSCTGCDPVWLTSGSNIGYLNGSVGIGTTVPLYDLDVRRTNAYSSISAWSSDAVTDGAGGAIYTQATNNYLYSLAYNSATTGTKMGINKANHTYLLSAGSASTGLTIGTETADDLTFGTNGAVNMTVQSGGNVGIGFTSPAAPLHIANNSQAIQILLERTGTAGNQLQFINNDTGNTSTDGFLVGFDGSENAILLNRENTDLQLWTNNTQRMTINNSGNVGIGFTSPNQLLHLRTAGADAIIRIQPTGGTYDAGILFDGDSQGQFLAGFDDTSNTFSIVNGTDFSSTNLLNIKTDGNIGIGTTNPGQLLELYEASPADNYTMYLSAGTVNHGMTNALPSNVFGAVGNSSTTQGGLFVAGYSDADYGGLILAGTIGNNNPTDTTAATEIRGRKKDAAGTGLAALGDAETILNITNNGTPRLTVLGNGNVGIGTSVPNYPLDINSISGMRIGSSAYGNNTLAVSQSSPFDIFTMQSSGYTGTWRGALNFDVGYNGGNAFTAMTIRANTDGTTGNVGIGTAVPLSNLEVAGASGATSISLRGTDNASGNLNNVELIHRFNYTGTSQTSGASIGFTRASSADGNYGSLITFSVRANGSSTAEKMRIDSAGNVGIGFTSPSQTLHVAGSARITTSVSVTDDRTLCTQASTGTIEFVNGACGTSSVRYKENVKNLEYGLDNIMALNPVFFNYKKDSDASSDLSLIDDRTKRRIGFIAEEVNQVIPEVTIWQNGQIESIDYAYLTALLTKGVQQLNSQVEAAKQFSLDSNGNVVGANLKVDKLTIPAGINLTASDIKKFLAYEQTTLSNGDTSYAVDIASSLDQISVKLAQLDQSAQSQATQSAQLAQQVASQSATTLTLAQQLASASAVIASAAKQSQEIATDLTGLRDDVSQLKLTPPETLLATGSAQLASLSVGSEATISGKLTAYQLDVQDILKSLGETILGTTTIAGDVTVDGTLSISNGQEINVIGLTEGILYLQKSPLAKGLNIFDGKVTIDKEGNIISSGTVAGASIITNKLTISNQSIASGSSSLTTGSSAVLAPTIGSSALPAGQTKITILTTQVSDLAKVFITPTSSTDKVLSVTGIKNNQSFDVSTLTPSPSDINFNWWIIQTE